MSAIEKHHKDFARAVVALARQHQMDKLTVTFQTGFDHPARATSHDQVTMSWSAGRHGDPSTINLECRAAEGIRELE